MRQPNIEMQQQMEALYAENEHLTREIAILRDTIKVSCAGWLTWITYEYLPDKVSRNAFTTNWSLVWKKKKRKKRNCQIQLPLTKEIKAFFSILNYFLSILIPFIRYGCVHRSTTSTVYKKSLAYFMCVWNALLLLPLLLLRPGKTDYKLFMSGFSLHRAFLFIQMTLFLLNIHLFFLLSLSLCCCCCCLFFPYILRYRNSNYE